MKNADLIRRARHFLTMRKMRSLRVTVADRLIADMLKAMKK